MQMYSLFDVESIVLTPVTQVSDTAPLAYYRRLEVKYKGGYAMITFYSNSEEEIEVTQEIEEPK